VRTRFALLLLIGCTRPSSTAPAPDPDTGASPPLPAPSPPQPSIDLGQPSLPDLSLPTSGIDCTGRGIAAYADQLVGKARVSCTSDGVGVVKQDNYACMSTAINQINPPYATTSFNVVSTLLANNTQYPFYECTYFVQTVTAGACNSPISPTGTVWTDYPFACSFINKAIQGYKWIDKTQGVVEVGDILLFNSSDGCTNDPGHIMIVAEVQDANHFRIAEANALYSDGSPGNGMDTGVVSNTRIQTLDDPALAPGWFRPGS
jgi:hypothetical protein